MTPTDLLGYCAAALTTLSFVPQALLTLDDGMLGRLLHLRACGPVDIRCRAHHTVSQSEAGFEKIMQAAEITIAWTIPNHACTLQIQLAIEPRTS